MHERELRSYRTLAAMHAPTYAAPTLAALLALASCTRPPRAPATRTTATNADAPAPAPAGPRWSGPVIRATFERCALDSMLGNGGELWLALQCADGAELRRTVVRDGALALVGRVVIASREESEGKRTSIAPDSAAPGGRFAASQPSLDANASGDVRVFEAGATRPSASLAAEFDSDSIRGTVLALRGPWLATDEDELLLYHHEGDRWRALPEIRVQDMAFYAGVGIDATGERAYLLSATRGHRGRFDVIALDPGGARVAQTVHTDEPQSAMVASGEGWAFLARGPQPRIQWVEGRAGVWAATRSLALAGLASETRLSELQLRGPYAIVSDRRHAWLLDTRAPQRATELPLPATVSNAATLQIAITATHAVVAVGSTLGLHPLS